MMSDSEPLTDAELAAFREVVNQATPGPWVARDGTSGNYFMYDVTCPCVPYVDTLGHEFRTLLQLNWNFPQNLANDREFIAQSREMCGRLLDEVDRLRADIEQREQWRRGRDENCEALKQVILGNLNPEGVRRDSREREIAKIFEQKVNALGEHIADLVDERVSLRNEVDRLKAALAAEW